MPDHPTKYMLLTGLTHRVSTDERSRATRIYNHVTATEYRKLVFSVAFVWGVLDTTSTYIALASYGGVRYELNPLLRTAMGIHPGLLLVAKTGFIGGATAIAMLGRQYIITVLWWRYYFYLQVVVGLAVTITNLIAASVAV